MIIITKNNIMEKEEYTQLIELYNKFNQEAQRKIKEKPIMYNETHIDILNMVGTFIKESAKENE